MQIEPTAHFHPQLASKAEKVFPIPLNRKTLMDRLSFVAKLGQKCHSRQMKKLKNITI